MAGRIQWEAQVDSNIAKLLGEAKELRDQLDGIKKEKYEIKLNIDEAKLEKVITNLDKMLENIGKGSGDFKEFEILSKNLIEIVSQVKNLTKAFDSINSSGINNLISSIQSIDKSLSLLSGSINKEFNDVGKNVNNNTEKIKEQKNVTEELTKANKELAESQKKSGNKTSSPILEKEALKDNIATLDSLKQHLGELFEDSKNVQKILDAINGKGNFYFNWTEDGLDTEIGKNPNKIRKLIDLLKEYGYEVKNLKEDSEAWSTSGTIVSSNAETLDFANATEKAAQSNKDFSKTNEEVKKSADKSTYSINEETKSLESFLSTMDKNIKGFNTNFETLSFKPDEEHRYPQYAHQLDNLNSKITEYKNLRHSISSKEIVSEEDRQKCSRLKEEIDDLITSIKRIPANEKGFTNISLDKTAEKINSLLKENSRMSKQAKNAIKAYYHEVVSGNPSRPLNEILDTVYKIVQAERAAGREGKSFFDLLKDKSVGNRAAQLVSYYLSFTDIIRYTSEGIRSIRELDTAMTEMRKVSDETVASLKEYQNASFDLANDVGTTAQQIQNSTADWMRLGEAMEDAAESAQVSNILLNVSEFEGIDEATESLVAMSQAYQDLEKIEIVDVLNNIGNNYSIATDGLATALQKSASALKTANNDLNEAVALATAGNAVVQDPDSVGAGLRTIALRLVGTEEAKEELESIGEDTDGVITTVSKLRDTILSATKAASEDGLGFDILDENGNYKSTYEIMQGLADLYDDIVAKDKELGTNNLNLLLETIAGKNRSNIAASILQNSDTLRSVFEDAQDSDGSAQEELDKYLDSIDGRMAKLENQAQEFWFKLIDTDLIKDGITALTNLLSLLTDIVDLLGAPGIIGLGGLGVGATSFIKNLD